ncbi:MAG: Nif3-like dinuclear metal center hexameric protein [Bacteroides sp.]|nr:Nif3-like dinuclear metal center hexameric protein [Bacteroides sp.]
MSDRPIKIADIIAAIEHAAPRALQEDYDNSGLQLGDAGCECSGVMLSVDVTPAVVEEAIRTGCNFILSHHPLLFKGLKRIAGRTEVEKSVALAIKHDITVYAAHTSLDNARNGVSACMAEMLGLVNSRPLVPVEGKMLKLATYVPVSHVEVVRKAMFSAGAGHIGDYDSCSFNIEGKGTFRALQGADPFVGRIGEIHTEPETRIEVIVPAWLADGVERALISAHPYEEPAYEFLQMANPCRSIGCGAIGELEAEMMPVEFVELVKATFGTPVARCNEAVNSSRPIKRIALCGGSGGSFIGAALAQGADAYITSDTRYHDFIDYGTQLLIVDIGHQESESCTKQIFFRIITEKFPNFAVRYAHTDRNPINYV